MGDDDEQPAWSKIWEIESKVKSISYLIEAQDPDHPQHLPWDMRDVYCGLSKLLWDFGEQLATIRRDLEEYDIKKSQKKKSKLRKK